MAAGKANYLIVWEKSAQVYSTANLVTALNTPLPKGCSEEDKHILFCSYLPDEKTMYVYPLTDQQIEEAVSDMQTKLDKKEKNE